MLRTHARTYVYIYLRTTLPCYVRAVCKYTCVYICTCTRACMFIVINNFVLLNISDLNDELELGSAFRYLGKSAFWCNFRFLESLKFLCKLMFSKSFK